MPEIQIHLPDGSVRSVAAGTTPYDVAFAISPRLAAASVVARIEPANAPVAVAVEAEDDKQASEAAMYSGTDAHAARLVDLATPLHEDVKLQLLTEKDVETLKVVRHSAAHVMATAVLELFPETKLGHGPGD